MGAYKFYNPTTQQWEIIKSKSIIKDDGSLEYTPDDIKSIEDDLLSHQAEKATQNEYGHIRLQDIPTPTKASVGLGNVDNVKQMPISGGVLENYTEKLVTEEVGGDKAINLSAGNVYQHRIVSNTNYILPDVPAGEAASITLMIDKGIGEYAITFPPNVMWIGGEIPVITAFGLIVFTGFYVEPENFTVWVGMFGGEF